MRSRKKEKWVVLVTGAVLLFIFIYRLFFGVELTDETFYAGIANRIYLGNVPLYDMWEQAQTSSLVIYPFLFLFRKITGSIDGIQLFVRLLYLGFAILSSIPFYLVIKKIGRGIAGIAPLFALLFVCYAPFSIYSVSYNTLLNAAMMACCSLVYLAFESERNRKKLLFGAGAIIAFGAFVYPTCILFCALLGGYLFIIYWRRSDIKQSFHIVKWFVFGGGCTCFLILGLLTVFVTPTAMLHGIQGILSDPAYAIGGGKSLLMNLFNKIWELLVYVFISFRMWIVVAVFVLVCFLKRKYPRIKYIMIVMPCVIFVLVCIPTLFQGNGGLSLTGFAESIFCLMPFIYFLSDKTRTVCKKIIISFWIPALLVFCNVALSSAGEVVQTGHSLITGAMGVVVIYVLVINEVSRARDEKKQVIGRNVASYLSICCFICIFIGAFYLYTYRDARPWNAPVRMESGPYKGLYTTAERKKELYHVETMLKEIEEKEKSILILHKAVWWYGYLDMKPATATIWGINGKRYPNNEEFMLEYYKEESFLPDKVVVADYYYLYTPEEWSAMYPELMSKMTTGLYHKTKHVPAAEGLAGMDVYEKKKK